MGHLIAAGAHGTLIGHWIKAGGQRAAAATATPYAGRSVIELLILLA